MKAYRIQTDKLASNIEAVRKKAGQKIIYGVLKGDGYGLGLLSLARILRDNGIDRFAVSETSDATKLRMAGFIDEEILILRSVSEDAEVEEILETKSVATIGSHDAAVMLGGIAEKRGEIVDAHIKIDTGMGRYGFLPTEFDKIAAVYRFFEKINVTGIYTHFPAAFCDAKRTRAQLLKLLDVTEKLKNLGYDPGVIHAGNSSALFKCDLSGTDAVRIGSAFTGRLPVKGAHGLTPVGFAVSNVAEMRWIPAGQTVGYGSVFTAKEATRIAVIPFGYSDGFTLAREHDIFRLRDKMRYILSDVEMLFKRKRLCVTVNDRKAPVLGHVGMVHIVADVTGCNCDLGDEVKIELSPLYASPNLERQYV